MIIVQINGAEREFDVHDVPESWIAQQISARERDGQAVCVRVRVNEDPINLRFQAGKCPPLGGGAGRLNEAQGRVVDIWNRLKVGEGDIEPGKLIAFLKQLRDAV